MIVFFDASALIYLIEAKPVFADRVKSELSALMQIHPDLSVAISRLTWLECRTGPLKSGDLSALALFDAFFARPDLIWIEMTKAVVELATAIRVRQGLRTPDALQAACCLQLGSEHVCLTGDSAFTRVNGLHARLLN